MNRDLYIDGRYFFTMFTKDRIPFFQHYDFCELFMRGVEVIKNAIDFDLDAYCILPDHVHLLITLPDGMRNYSDLIVPLRFGVTRFFEKYVDMPIRTVWEEKYLVHTIQDPHDAQTHFDFIHYNPVHHGYVNNIDYWPWSSIDLESDNRDITTRLSEINKLSQSGCMFAE